MNEHDMKDGEGNVPSLVSLALFGVVFLSAILVAEFGSGLIEPVRLAVAALPASLKAAALVVVILGAMAIARIAILLGGSHKGRAE